MNSDSDDDHESARAAQPAARPGARVKQESCCRITCIVMKAHGHDSDARTRTPVQLPAGQSASESLRVTGSVGTQTVLPVRPAVPVSGLSSAFRVQ